MGACECRNELVSVLSGCPEILGIGQTGKRDEPLIPGKSDIDLFVLCREVPSRERRIEMYRSLEGKYGLPDLEVCSGGVWGCGDIFHVEGIDVMPMYFSIAEMTAYVDEVLDGKHLRKEGRFYPIGRLASIDTINILFETENSWTGIVEKVKSRPEALFQKWYQSEINQMIDEEDLGRALLRRDPLFFHQVLEEFLDHFLQALFARNRCYFPGRKRNAAYIASFAIKPENCVERLLKLIRTACSGDTIENSVAELRALAEELKRL